jgi:streptogramin lyase
MRKMFLAAVCVLSLAGCSLRGAAPVAVPAPAEPGVAPQVAQHGGGAQWVQFKANAFGALYSAIVAGSDGNMWFLDEDAAGLVRMSMSGGSKEFRLSGPLNASAVSMTVGADHDFYILDETTSVVRVTQNGVAKSFPIPSGDGTSIDSAGLGPDGNVWFAEFNHIAKITPAGKITEFAYPTQPGTNQYGGVTAGADGNVWFSESSQNAIGRVIPSTGKITMFTIPTSCTPSAIVLAKDDNIWFACLSNAPLVGRITKNGAIATFPIGGAFSSNETEQFGARGPDGEPWFASGNNGVIFRVNTASHTATDFTPPLSAGERPDAVAAGPDGNIWVDSVGGGHIDVLVFNPMTVSPLSLSFTAVGQTKSVTVTEKGTTAWTATSSDVAVATVRQGSPSATFVVKSVGAGKCRVTISDGATNSVSVKVNVI